ncbi:MAG: DNA helicase RecG, partial [Chloroflexaceae bacterium]|nr:DNA helicase RecG [Chloroflexaceae bacterium]
MTTDWDWLRLQKALAVEAERGFTDLMGRQYRFSEFLCLSLGQSPPAATPPTERRRTQELAAQFARYSQLTRSERQHLVAETRRFLLKIQRILAAPSPSPPQLPRTAPLAGTCGPRPGLNQPLRDLSGVGPSRSEQLGRLGLVYVRDLLFYYPRDYIDYARQVKIAQLVAGETVTVIGTIKRCTCFTSPKNQKLTIFELQLQDATGNLKLSRFFAGGRFNQVGWQQKYKRQYPVGAIAAASGLVKQSKYGFTLENPEIEVLESSRDAIESAEIGRV